MTTREARLKAATATADTWAYVPEIREAIDAARPDNLGITDWDWAVIVAYARRPLETAQETALRLQNRVALHVERWGRPMTPNALLDIDTTP